MLAVGRGNDVSSSPSSHQALMAQKYVAVQWIYLLADGVENARAVLERGVLPVEPTLSPFDLFPNAESIDVNSSTIIGSLPLLAGTGLQANMVGEWRKQCRCKLGSMMQHGIVLAMHSPLCTVEHSSV